MNVITNFIYLIYTKIRFFFLVINFKFLKKTEKNLSSFELEIINDLEKKGFSIVENYFSKEQCKELSSKIRLFIENNSTKIYEGKHSSDKRIFGAEYIDHQINEYYNSSDLIQIGNFYMKCELENLMTMANETTYKDNNLGSGEGWHRDSVNKQFKSILYLEDVNTNNGPFQFLKNSNQILDILRDNSVLNKEIENTRYTDDEVKELLKHDPNRLQTLNYKAGTLIIVDTSLIHRGAPIKSGTRYALTNYYYPKKIILDYKDHFKPMLNKFEY